MEMRGRGNCSKMIKLLVELRWLWERRCLKNDKEEMEQKGSSPGDNQILELNEEVAKDSQGTHSSVEAPYHSCQEKCDGSLMKYGSLH